MMKYSNVARWVGLVLSVSAAGMMLTGCGGGGSSPAANLNPGSGSGGGSTNPAEPQWQAGVYPAANTLKDFCATPRTGIDPYTKAAYPDKPGSANYEKMWLRSWTNETYLWYKEVADRNPAGYSVPDYFKLLKTEATTDSGAKKDKYHYSQSTAEYMKERELGLASGYGFEIALIKATPPRNITIAIVEPSSAAAAAGLVRGAMLLTVDGIDAVNDSTDSGINKITAGLFSPNAGEMHEFKFRMPDGSDKTFRLTAADIQISPVQNVAIHNTSKGKVGYMTFTTHIQSAQTPLIDAMQRFSDNGVSEVVVDLRYNGGGLLFLASQLAYMSTGPNIIQSRYFSKLVFNDRSPNRNPVTGELSEPTPFYDFEYDFKTERVTTRKLPTLNLRRIFVLTTDGTCSASEAFMNSLRGIDVEVVQIGSQTCGKPYGFTPTSNCGTTYSTIQFRSDNAKGFGDYPDGFRPTPNPVFSTDVKGCVVGDDFKNPLGNKNEGMLKTALHYVENNSCPSNAAPLAAPVNDETYDGPQFPSETYQRTKLLKDNMLIVPIKH